MQLVQGRKILIQFKVDFSTSRNILRSFICYNANDKADTVLTYTASVCCSCVGSRECLHLGVHLAGALLCHLPAAALSQLADAVPQLQDDRWGVGGVAGHDGAHSGVPEAAAHAERRTQVCGGEQASWAPITTQPRVWYNLLANLAINTWFIMVILYTEHILHRGPP